MASISEDDRSPSDTPTTWQQGKTKRAQVKNACVNCQRACKKCDSGRPCQRCVKYSMADTCVDSKRKPRKKGIKRGPYKKRKKNSSQDEDVHSAAADSPTLSESAAMASMSAVPALKPPPPTARRSASSRRPPRTTSATAASASLSDRPSRPHRPRPPQILGPGAIPILHTDPLQDDDDKESNGTPEGRGTTSSSGSDTPLVHHQPLFQQPETPTMGLTAAFNTLATAHRYHHNPLSYSQSQAIGASTTSSSTTLRYSHPESYRHAVPPPPPPFSRGTGPLRLPPIESFDHAQALSSPPQTSSLAMLTDVALGRTSQQTNTLPSSSAATTTQQDHHRQQQNLHTPSIHTIPPNTHHLPPGQPLQGRPRSTSDVEQQSHLDIPEDPQASRYTTSAESDMSSVPSSFDSRQSIYSNDKTSRAHIRRLSRRLHNTHLEQESSAAAASDLAQSDNAHSF